MPTASVVVGGVVTGGSCTCGTGSGGSVTCEGPVTEGTVAVGTGRCETAGPFVPPGTAGGSGVEPAVGASAGRCCEGSGVERALLSAPGRGAAPPGPGGGEVSPALPRAEPAGGS